MREKFKCMVTTLVVTGCIQASEIKPSMVPLKEYIEKHELDKDDGAKGYVALRCGCLYLTTIITMKPRGNEKDNAKLEDFKVFKKDYNDRAVKFLVLSGKLMDVKNEDAEESIKRMTTAYLEDTQSNYIKTGNFIIGSYLEGDLALCKQFESAFSKYLDVKE